MQQPLSSYIFDISTIKANIELTWIENDSNTNNSDTLQIGIDARWNYYHI
jgi:beta-glucanase (GH16 family)